MDAVGATFPWDRRRCGPCPSRRWMPAARSSTTRSRAIRSGRRRQTRTASAWARGKVQRALAHLDSVRPGLVTRRRRRVWTALILSATTPASGCYSTQPVTTVPEPGATVVLDLNDRARYLLGDRIGPAAAKIEGVMQSGSDSGYVINISSVSYLNGQTNKWSGEQFRVSPDLVSQAWRRDFS